MAQDNEEIKEEKNEKNAPEETKVSEELFRIPKNIRQIGKEESKRKLYIEDYVLNLMKQLSKRNSMDYQMAVLLGQAVHSDGVLYLFVKGAVEVHKLSLDSNDNFTGDTWSAIYSQIKQHFHDVDIVGWYLTKPGLKESPDLKLTRIHERNFQGKKNDTEKGSGENRCLLLYDSIENRENYFIYDHNRFKKAHGYYIYYERNQDMQEYLISRSSNLSIENGYEDFAVRKIRQAMQKDAETEKKATENEGKRLRESVIVNKSADKKENEDGNTKNRLQNTPVKVKAAIIALFIMFVCIMAAKSNLGESRDVWNNSGETGGSDVVGSEGTDKSGSVNGWVLYEEDKNGDLEEENGGEDSSSVELPEMSIIPNGENPENDYTSDEKNGLDNEDASGNTNNEGNEKEDGNNEDNGTDDENDGNNEDNGTGNENDGNNDRTGTGNENDKNTGDNQTGSEKDNSEETGEDNTANEGDSNSVNVRYYTVKEGDTLASISLKEYHTILRAAEIQELNNIEDPDLIYTGQTLIIP